MDFHQLEIDLQFGGRFYDNSESLAGRGRVNYLSDEFGVRGTFKLWIQFVGRIRWRGLKFGDRTCNGQELIGRLSRRLILFH